MTSKMGLIVMNIIWDFTLVLFVSWVFSNTCNWCCVFEDCFGVTMGLLLGVTVSILVCELSDASDTSDDDLIRKRNTFLT